MGDVVAGRTVQRVVAQLREEIVASVPRGSIDLGEHAVASRLGVSRSTAKEALLQLASERLVVVAPYQGASVRTPTMDDVRELQEVRAALEGAAATALQRAHGPGPWPRDLARPLGEALDAIRAADPADTRQVDRAHLAFHQAVVDTAGNTRLSRLHRSLEAETRLLHAASPEHRPTDMVRVHEEYVAQLLLRGCDAVADHLLI